MESVLVSLQVWRTLVDNPGTDHGPAVQRAAVADGIRQIADVESTIDARR